MAESALRGVPLGRAAAHSPGPTPCGAPGPGGAAGGGGGHGVLASALVRRLTGCRGAVFGATAAFGVLVHHRVRPRRSRAAARAYRDGSETRHVSDLGGGSESMPSTLYELLKVSPDADEQDVKKAYYKMQKICHPDVAGDEGEEMCILLNDAYEVLSDPKGRAAYNEQLAVHSSIDMVKPASKVSDDLGPTWTWTPKKHKSAPVWTGVPRSRSLWDTVPIEDRGKKHVSQQFVYVDEFQCIACRNCCDVAPRTFCIDADHGRARVYSQWGNSEESLDYAVMSCPVDCISWVSRAELQALEHVTAAKLDEVGELPCPMSMRQGTYQGPRQDPFGAARMFAAQRRRAEEEGHHRFGSLQVAADKFKERIGEVFAQLSAALRRAGWGLQ